MVPLSDGIMKSFYPRFSFPRCNPHPNKRITSIKFSASGTHLVEVGNDHVVKLYNCDQGTTEQTMDVRKYGGLLADFMDGNDRVLLTSTKKDHCLREMNFTRRGYQTVYDGHTDLVVSLAVHRESHIFLTGSKDKSVGLWDFRTQLPQSYQNKMSDTPLVAFESRGNMFVVGLPHTIELYDLRGLGYGPFNEFAFNRDDTNWTNIKLSPKGDQILMSSSSARIRLMDAFFGRVVRNFESKKPDMASLPM